MKPKDQVSSLEPSKRLKELGVKQDGYFHWYQAIDKVFYLGIKTEGLTVSGIPPRMETASAFTVAELGEMLPLETFTMRSSKQRWHGVDEDSISMARHGVFADTEADARAKMLIYLLENKLIEVPK